jgi:heme A synthase
LAQLFFCTTVSLAVFTSRSWHQAPSLEENGQPPLRHLSTIALAAIFVQLILGATLRHSATWDKPLPVDMVLAHVAGAFVVVLALGGATISVLRRHKGETYLTRPAAIALSLMFVQLLLGLASYLVRQSSPNDPQPLHPMIGVTVAHVACGALVFATTIVLTLRVYRVLPASRSAIALNARPQES